jgi:membrane protein implicated in regulation of membrane protease activity
MLIYGAIAAFGFLILLAMLLAGEVFGGDHEVGAHDISVEHGDADHGGGPSVFSVRIMAAFVSAFGVGGVVARYYRLSHPASSGVGIISGIVMAAVVYRFAKFLYSQQASSEVRMTSLVGQPAEVSVAIPAGGLGQVALTMAGERSEHIARAADGQAVPRGAAVVITRLLGDSVVVRPADPASRGGSQ